MYTLRKISKKGKYEMNISLGKGYTLTTRESEKEFKEYLEMNGRDDENIFAFVTGDSTGVLALVTTQHNYIMTESGATFDNLNKYAHCLNQNKMEKEFLPYELAVKLKTLGFDEPCLCSWNFYTNELNFNGQPSTFSSKDVIQLPTFSQAFRFFRESYNAVCEIIRKEDKNHSEFIGWVYIYNRKIDVVSYWDPKTYEEAELDCLDKLIELTFKSEELLDKTISGN